MKNNNTMGRELFHSLRQEYKILWHALIAKAVIVTNPRTKAIILALN